MKPKDLNWIGGIKRFCLSITKKKRLRFILIADKDILKSNRLECIKIGVSKNVAKTIRKMCAKYPDKYIKEILSAYVENPETVKDILVNEFKDRVVKPEWFKITPEDIIVALRKNNIKLHHPIYCSTYIGTDDLARNGLLPTNRG